MNQLATQQMTTDRRFYVYAYLRVDGTPYYVGKGTGRRIHQPHAVLMPPVDRRKVLMGKLTEDEAFDYEISLIHCLGRKDQGTGCLRNRTDGGEGGSNPSAETLAKRVEKLKEVEHTQEWITKRVVPCLKRSAEKYGFSFEEWVSFDEKQRCRIRARFNREGSVEKLSRQKHEREGLSEWLKKLEISRDVWDGLSTNKKAAIKTKHRRTGKTGAELLAMEPSPEERARKAAAEAGVDFSVWQGLSRNERKRLSRAS